MSRLSRYVRLLGADTVLYKIGAPNHKAAQPPVLAMIRSSFSGASRNSCWRGFTAQGGAYLRG